MQAREEIISFYRQARQSPEPYFACESGVQHVKDMFSVAKFQEMLNNPLLVPPWIQVKAEGKPLGFDGDLLGKRVQQSELRFLDKRGLDHAIRRGASVVLEGLDILDSSINRLLAEIDLEMPCSLSNCVAFFSQANNEAYRGHLDTDDVLVLQVSGEKCWSLYEPQPRRLVDIFPLDKAALGAKIGELVMKPGDLLYVRSGTPHQCETLGSHSLHLSFDLWDQTPGVQEIASLALDMYSRGTAPVYASPDAVTRHFTSCVESDLVRKTIQEAYVQTKDKARRFRERINGASCVRALDQFVDQSK